nr:MAG TPA: hypothetical protein [Caudoviricetes sp.]
MNFFHKLNFLKNKLLPPDSPMFSHRIFGSYTVPQPCLP